MGRSEISRRRFMAVLAATSAVAASRALPVRAAEASPENPSGTAAPAATPTGGTSFSAEEKIEIEKQTAELEKALAKIRDVKLGDGSEPGTRFVPEREWERTPRGARRRVHRGS